MKRYLLPALSLFFLVSVAFVSKKDKPVIYIIGDSTVKNGSGKGDGGLWGWGDFLYTQIDTGRISIRNHAIGGRSSRTFISEGRWDKVLSQLNKGDYVIIQFGHNDSGPVNDNFRARGTIKGTGNESEEIDNILTKKHETVNTFGWYMRKYVNDTKAKGATPILCSLVPRNSWRDGVVARSSNDYAKWTAESAATENAFFLDLNELIAAEYESIGQDEVKEKLFSTDNTHTTKEGAMLNASIVAKGIMTLKGCKLKKFIL